MKLKAINQTERIAKRRSLKTLNQGDMAIFEHDYENTDSRAASIKMHS